MQDLDAALRLGPPFSGLTNSVPIITCLYEMRRDDDEVSSTTMMC